MSDAISVCHGAFGRAGLYNLDKPIAPHAHKENHLIFHLGGALARTDISDDRIRMKRGTVIAVNPLEQHSFLPSPSGRSSLLLVLYIQPDWFLGTVGCKAKSFRFGKNLIEIAPVCSHMIECLRVLLCDEPNQRLIEAFLLEVCLHCFRKSWLEDQTSEGRYDNSCSITDARIRRTIEEIKQSDDHDLAMAELARKSGLSASHFFSVFKREVGVTPMLYLNAIRAERAIKEVATTEKSLEEIAHQLGFSSPSSFSRFFAANVGVAPNYYRRAMSTV